MKTSFLHGLFVAIFALSLTACSFATDATPVPATDLPASSPATVVPTLLVATNLPTEQLATETPLSVISATPTSNQVTITVIKESLYVRRGPSTEYDVLGTFISGETVVALYRNVQSSWVYIPIPSYPSAYGWVSLQSQFTSVQGEVSSLDVKNADPVVPARIRNCTFHPMLIQPGNVLIDPQFNAPNNTHNFPPGSYAAYDQNQEGHPKVASFSLTEGKKVDINKDGLGNSYYCP